jgi:hypothetical protein
MLGLRTQLSRSAVIRVATARLAVRDARYERKERP